jgi:hypothetical protein
MNNRKGESRKAQVATEFFIYAGVFLIIVIAAAALTQFTQSNEVKESGYYFSDSINLAVRGGKGFNYTLDFQPNLLGSPYNIYFDKGVVFIFWNGPQGNMSYAYNTIPFEMNYKICNNPAQKANMLVSDAGVNQMIVSNDGSKLTIVRSCS